MAIFTRSRASCSARSPSPTMWNPGRPSAMSASTSTRTPSRRRPGRGCSLSTTSADITLVCLSAPANQVAWCPIVVRSRVIGHSMDWKQTASRGLGWVTTLPYRARTRISIGPRLLGNGRLRISGPGRDVFGGGANAWSHAEVNRLITTRPEAVIHIGRHARLNGCTIVGADRVDVGADCVLGSCEVRDHLPYSESPVDRRRPGHAQPVVIETNVWIGGQVSVLPGVRIGRDSVVGIHAVVFDDVPSGVIVGGNPARVFRRLCSCAVGDNRDQ